MSGPAHQRAQRRAAARAGAAAHRPPAPRPPSRFTILLRHPPAWAAALALVLLHLLLAIAVFDPTVFTGGDNAAYLSLAHSLLERHAYLSTWEPLTPPHTQYPPVFPGMIALALLLGVKGWVGIKWLVMLCSAAGVALTYLWLRRRRRPGLALGVAFVVAISPGVLALSHIELSDVPFWAFAVLALWAFERLGPREHLRFAIAVVAVVLAYFTRSAGLPLVLAALAWLAWRRRWRQLAILAVIIVPLAFLWWLRGHLQGGSAYGQLFWYVDPYRPALGRIGPADLFARMFANERSYLGTNLPVLLSEQPTIVMAVISYAIALLAIYGWVMRLRRLQVAEIFFPLYVGLLFVWPQIWASERFLLPAFPLLLAYAGDGAVRLIRLVRRRAVAPLAVAAVIVLALLDLPAIARDATANSVCREANAAGAPVACLEQPWQDFFDLAEWARTGLPPGASAFSRKPRLFYVYSGHHSHDIPTTQDPRQFLETARANRIDYIVVDRLGGLTLEYFGPILAAHPDAFCAVQSTPDQGAVLLKLQPNAATLLTGPPRPASEQLSLAACPP